MRIRNLLFCALLGSSINMQAQIERPKLIVGIVVDQMRMEHLYRFQPHFSKNGFNRLVNEGFTFTNMHYSYAPTITAPGHASIYTGTTPYNHGIMANSWYNRSLKKEMYCTDDESVKPLGNPDKDQEGLMSPKNLQSSTVTDELRLATNFRGKVYGVSMKDRGAILPAGHFANRAYWLSDNGNFISSTYYGDKLPSWVTDYNSQKKYMKYINQGWNLLKPISVYQDASDTDENPYEKIYYNKDEKAVFPYNLQEAYKKFGAKILKLLPFSNDMITDFSKEIVTREGLGTDNDTDFLAISYSSTDAISHVTSPRSVEVQDTYLRLDENIADLLTFLDNKVGKGNYIVFLTADHSAAETPGYLAKHGYKVEAVNRSQIVKNLEEFSTKTFGKNFIENYSNQNIYLDETAIEAADKNIDDVIEKLVKYIESWSFVKRVYTEEQILNASPADQHATMLLKGYDKTQNGQLYILLKPAYMIWPQHGTTHGTSYTYDTHVPGVFFGWKIPQGKSHRKVAITDIAPTISQKTSITFPNSTLANSLLEILE